MDQCPQHSGIEEKFATILAEIRAIRESQKASDTLAKAEIEKHEKQHNEDVAFIHKRISEKVEERNELIGDIEKTIVELNASIVNLKDEIKKTTIRVLVWVVISLGIPVASWFVTQTIELILKNGGKP